MSPEPSAMAGALAVGVLTTSTEQAHEISGYAIADLTAFLLSDLPADPLMTIPWQGQEGRTGAKEWAAFQPLRDEATTLAEYLGMGGLLGLGLGGAGLGLTAGRRRRKEEALLADRVIAGTRVISEAELARMTATESSQNALRLGSVTIPSRLQNRHFCIVGTTGAGKTTALRQLLDVIEARGDAALIYDTSGEFIEYYYDPARGDVILNPFDQRGAFWDLFGEISHPATATRIAHYLINATGDRDKDVWLETARILVANILRTLWQEGLVGDTAQLGSVEAGAAFTQLQGAGMETARLTHILRQTNEHAKAAVEASLAGDAKKALAALDSGGGRIVEQGTREARFAQIAQDYARLDTKERRKALVIEPSREGRDTLTQEICHALAERGQLHGPAIAVTKLVSKDMTRAEAKDPHSYAIGDMIRFAKDYTDKGVSKAQAYRVTGIDTGKAAILLAAPTGRPIDWRLRQWGAAQSQAFTAETIELRAGDKMQFTRNDRVLGRINGQQGEIIAVDPGTNRATVRLAGGKTETLTLDNPRDQHIAHAYVATAFAAQGRTAERTFIHADCAATHLIDQKSFYVALSRAQQTTAVYTNDRTKLVAAIQERSGVKQTALAPAASATVAKSAAAVFKGLAL